MGVKKKKDETTKLVSKIFIVCVCVLFVGLMILSGMGTVWLTFFTSVKSGDTVELDYTVYDSLGNPLLTSDQQIYNQRINSGYGIIFSVNNLYFIHSTGHFQVFVSN
jgi:biotin transporter BioY